VPIVITIAGPNLLKPRRLEVSSNDSVAEDKILDFLIVTLSAAGSGETRQT
jgi:hypothetical protein